MRFFFSISFPQFMDCFMIGRDLVRLLQNVARIPEFEQLWKDIIHNPQVLSAQFTGKAGPGAEGMATSVLHCPPAGDNLCRGPASHRQPPPAFARPCSKAAVTVGPSQGELEQKIPHSGCFSLRTPRLVQVSGPCWSRQALFQSKTHWVCGFLPDALLEESTQREL